jgi:hypothetical protein
VEKSIKLEVTKTEITRSKLSLNKETLRQLKVRSGLKAGIVSPTLGCQQAGWAAPSPNPVPLTAIGCRF